ncbi:hypothetical protein ACFXKS_17020 [Streptomyces scopuliridis]|uniref:hypothetical protein n=1 Tax=Streptomyces scopuliridis TaxID=452529 RepID=UPI0036BF52D3
MTDASPSFYWLSRPGAKTPHRSWQPLSDAAYWENPNRKPDRHPLLAPPPEWADDLLRVARAVFAADRHALRERSFDRWTRHIRLSIPVTDRELWERAEPHLVMLLQNMTGDLWEISFRALDSGTPTSEPMTAPIDELAQEVTLFSGGLDSLSWAIQRATVRTSRPLLFVSFDERNFEELQFDLYSAVERRRERPLRRLTQSQTVRGPKGAHAKLERTTRSRGLLYVATAVHAAAAESVAVVHVPENGQLALNPPLPAARSGANSTRSVHPATLYRLNLLIEAVGGCVRVENPLAHQTKGEVCAAARESGLSQDVLEATLSCGAPPRRQNIQSELANCGLCYPCLVRRSGLLHAYGTDRTPYTADPWDPRLPHDRTGHWRALRRWLDAPCSAIDLVTDTPLPPDARVDTLFQVIQRGRDELRSLLRLQRRSIE